MPSIPIADIRNSFGAAFVGLLINTALFGFTIVQTWIYFWYLIRNICNVESLEDSMWALNIRHPELSYFHGHSRYSHLMQIVVGASVQLFVPLCKTSLCHEPKTHLSNSDCGVSRHWLHHWNLFSLNRFTSDHSLLFWGTSWLPRRCVGISTAGGPGFHQFGFADGFIVSPTSLIWLGLSWAMSKCKVSIWLNIREYLRDRSTPGELDNAHSLSFIRVGSEAGIFLSTVPVPPQRTYLLVYEYPRESFTRLRGSRRSRRVLVEVDWTWTFILTNVSVRNVAWSGELRNKLLTLFSALRARLYYATPSDRHRRCHWATEGNGSVPSVSTGTTSLSFQCPHHVERVGVLGDGGKQVCGMERFAKQAKCVIYSFSINGESSFKAALLECVPRVVTLETHKLLSPFSSTTLPIGQLQIELHAWDDYGKFDFFHDWWAALEAAGTRPFWT
ncbi:hypothetical protein EDB85DRAFT_2273769, partial [Lactarius pseudohatsudake]